MMVIVSAAVQLLMVPVTIYWYGEPVAVRPVTLMEEVVSPPGFHKKLLAPLTVSVVESPSQMVGSPETVNVTPVTTVTVWLTRFTQPEMASVTTMEKLYIPAPQVVKSNICEAVFAVFGVTQEGMVSHKKVDPGLAPEIVIVDCNTGSLVQIKGFTAEIIGVG